MFYPQGKDMCKEFPSLGEGGFTLIEVIIVIVIMSTAFGLLAPKIGNSLQKMKLRAASQKLAAVLRYSRQMAITRKKEYKVTINNSPDDHNGPSYTYTKVEFGKKGTDQDHEEFESRGKSNEEPVGVSKLSQEIKRLKKSIKENPKTVSLSKGNNKDNFHLSYYGRDEEEGFTEDGKSGEIIFYPKGECTGGRIVLALGENKLAFQIEVDPITGKVRVFRKDKEE